MSDALMEFVFLGAMAAIAAIAWWFAALRAHRLSPVRHQLARFDILWTTRDKGVLHLDDVPLQVEASYYEHHLQGLTFRWPARGLGAGMALESLPGLLRTDLVVGDARFDEAVRVEVSDDAVALAVLDQRTRRAVRRVLEAGAVYVDDRWALSADAVGDDDLEARIREVHEVFEALAPPADAEALRQALEARATLDPAAGVRAHALDVMVRRGLARDGFLARCEGDLQPGIRLTAARARGHRGQATLEGLVARASRTHRFEAACALLELGVREPALPVLIEALDDDELVAGAAAALAARGGPELLPAMGAAHHRRPHPVLATAMDTLRARGQGDTAGALSLASSDGKLSVVSAPGSEPADDELANRPRGVLHGEEAMARGVGDHEVGS